MIKEYYRFDTEDDQTKKRVIELSNYIKKRLKNKSIKKDKTRWDGIRKKAAVFNLWFLLDDKIFYLFIANIINRNQ